MENVGSALSIENFPLNLATNVQVYKGVVPIYLSSDALGGAINIETPALDSDFVDVSYSYGSFDTHRLALFGQKTADNGLFVRVSSFYNDTDNSYDMVDVPTQDELGNNTGKTTVERFHDDYSSGMVNVRGGVLHRAYFDELSLSYTHAENYNELQHPARSINRVFGKVYSVNDTDLVSLTATKYWALGQFKGYLMKGTSADTFHDTAPRRYNWTGTYTDRAEGYGEFGTASVFTREDDITRANLYAEYDITTQHSLGVGLVYGRTDREGEDAVNPVNTSFTEPNWLAKTVASVAWDYTSDYGALDLTVFSKWYRYEAETNISEYVAGGDQIVSRNSTDDQVGYGIGALYTLSERWAARASYELAYRIPEADEILGDGEKYVRANPELSVEQSHNFNAGLVNRLELDAVTATTELNAFYRNASDFIKFNQDRVVSGVYQNIADVQITGVEFVTSVKIADVYSVDFNVTQQSMIDKSELTVDGLENDGYDEELPNEPSLFANLRFGARYPISGYTTGIFMNSHYVNDFDLYSTTYGSSDGKNRVPSQLYHDLEIEASSPDQRYHIGFLASNLTDEALYDNFDIQKPGRAFYLKLRYSTR